MGAAEMAAISRRGKFRETRPDRGRTIKVSRKLKITGIVRR
jgi:hypothetical protein